jgi:hypothetical protein
MKVRLTTREDLHLPYYSHSIVEAIATCPKWGTIRYKQRKYFHHTARQLALEAGSAMHDVFAALRLWQLLRLQGLPDHFEFHGKRLFGEDRFASTFFPRPDPRDEALAYCFEILNTTEYYDDPADRTRTLANMEETTIRYVTDMLQKADTNPIWVSDVNDPTAPVGIEIPFDLVIDDEIRYIGTIDGICQRSDGSLRLEENKTASRLDEAWRGAFEVKSQPTGYMVAARAISGNDDISSARIIGVKLKQTRSHEDMLIFNIDREPDHIMSWYRTLRFAHQLAEQFSANPLEAPEFTHSCNRYFRPCAFIPLCSATMEDQILTYENMDETPPSPSEASILKKWETVP